MVDNHCMVPLNSLSCQRINRYLNNVLEIHGPTGRNLRHKHISLGKDTFTESNTRQRIRCARGHLPIHAECPSLGATRFTVGAFVRHGHDHT